MTLLSAVALGQSAWVPATVSFHVGTTDATGTEAAYAATVDGDDYQCDYDTENPLLGIDLSTYTDLGSYLYNLDGESCPCTRITASGGYSWWEVNLDAEYLITAVAITVNMGVEVGNLDVWLDNDDDDWNYCGYHLNDGTDSSAVIYCDGAGVYGSRLSIDGFSGEEFTLCGVELLGYPFPETVIEPLEEQLEDIRLDHDWMGYHYDNVQDQYNDLSDYYDQV